MISPMYICHEPLNLSQQSFNPRFCTSTGTEFLHPHHIHGPGDSMNSAANRQLADP